MVDARWQDDEILLLEANAHPVVAGVADVKESLAIENVPNFLVLVQVLGEERLHLLLVNGAHLLRGHRDLVPVLVTALLCDRIDVAHRRASAVEDA